MLPLVFWEGFACGAVTFIVLLVALARAVEKRRKTTGPDVFVVLADGQFVAGLPTAELAVQVVNMVRSRAKSITTAIVGYRPVSELESVGAE